ncbi:MAG TPA: tetratricopeptide repeat protein, partial [Saprospiraceae bacterium]|nr:tetratricopeptide repeat protein [Saprospiraceae bacterium]
VYNDDLMQYEKAVQHGMRACHLDSVFPLAHYNLGNAYQLSNQYQNAAAEFEKVINLDSLYVNAYFNLSLVYFALERFEDAKIMILTFNRHKEKDPSAWVNLGEIERKLGNNEAALEHFHHALQIDPEYDAAYISLAEYHIEKGHLVQADSALLQCIRVSPDHAIAYFYLASNSCQIGKTELALNYFEISFAKGFNDWQKLEGDPSFKIMSPLSQFGSMLEKYRAKRPD